MKSKKYNKFLDFILAKIIIFNYFIKTILSYTIGDYPYAKRLNNGKYIVFSSTNIVTLDKTLTIELNNIDLNTSVYNSREDTYSTIAEQFLVKDDEYVVSILKKTIYIFSKEGILLKSEEFTFINETMVHSIIPYGHSGFNYYFAIIFSNNEFNSLIFKKCTYNSESKTISSNSNFSFSAKDQYNNSLIFSKSFSCKLMIYNNKDVINCIYGNYDYLVSTIFDPNDDFNTITLLPTQFVSTHSIAFKIEVLPDKREDAIVCNYKDGDNFLCRTYNILSNSFGDGNPIGNNKCNIYPSALMIEYFYETEEIIVGCTGYYIELTLAKFYKNLTFQNLGTIEGAPPGYEGITRTNIIFPTNQDKYGVLVGMICNSCNGEKIFLQKLDGIEIVVNSPTDELYCSNYYNFDHTACIEIIPEGFYCNNTLEKTIDKCHENCLNCSKGPTYDNNNCLKCHSNGKEYFDLGNCTNNCTNGYFIKDYIKICKCSTNITCEYCSLESKQYNLCESCNNELGFYQKINDLNNINSFLNCYNNTSISNGYYLNIKNLQYEQCYPSCKKCEEIGNERDNKCIECNPEYSFVINNNGIKNCYKDCPKLFYFDSENKYICVDECPKNYKLINSTNKCIDDCNKDIIYNFKYEYKNVCYHTCPENTHESENNNKLCEANLVCDIYYNYNHTGCLSELPDGFFCNNSALQTIDKCHENCKVCERKPTNNNNKCLKCYNSGKVYYDLGNCTDKCINGFFIDNDDPNGQNLKCKCSKDIKCQFCTEEGFCKICNNEDGFYSKSNETRNDGYVDCFKNPEGFYLNNKLYEPCYPSCKNCSSIGDEDNNNCIECFPNFEFKYDFDNDKNCYKKCPYNYYYDSNNKYICSEENNCPQLFNKYIEEKKRCIDECKNDNIYKYEYQNKCFKNCPINTTKSLNNNFLCEKIKEIEEDKEKCQLNKKNLKFQEEEISKEYMQSLTEDYINQYGISNNYVSNIENNKYKIYIYKNITCVEITSGEAPQIDFGKCYDDVKSFYEIKDDLIKVIINIKLDKDSNNNKPLLKYIFAHPETGEVLNISEICAEEKIIVQEDVMSLMEEIDNRKEEYIIHLTKQGIDVFNISDEFYNDMCYNYESPNGKDIPLKERISAIFPNITLCDPGCESQGVDLEKMKAKCICAFSDFMNNDLMNNVYGQTIAEFMNILTSINIFVVQCIKDIFVLEHFKECIGGFIILCLLLGEIICILIYIRHGLYNIRKYLFALTESFSLYIKKNPIVNSPPIKIKRSKSIKSNIKNKKISKKFENTENLSINKNMSQKKSNFAMIPKLPIITSIQKGRSFALKGKEDSKTKKSKFSKDQMNTDREFLEKNEYINIIKDFLSPSYDERDFDDVIEGDKRKFCEYFCEKFKNNQLFINTFCINEIMKPKSLKCLILIAKIELYFVINALFYTEEYLTELFYSTQKETFFSFIPRRINAFIYISAAGGIITYLIEYFFVEEQKLKRIFVRNKKDKIKIKYELSKLNKEIERKFITLICSSIIFTIISFIYISCFNKVYPCIKIEWIKSSFFIILLIQIINFSLTFTECCFRFLAIKCNSERMFRLHLLLA